MQNNCKQLPQPMKNRPPPGLHGIQSRCNHMLPCKWDGSLHPQQCLLLVCCQSTQPRKQSFFPWFCLAGNPFVHENHLTIYQHKILLNRYCRWTRDFLQTQTLREYYFLTVFFGNTPASKPLLKETPTLCVCEMCSFGYDAPNSFQTAVCP